uniref:Uncharacterized protein n=1 Tax=Quercus lobata TaxID=97700 RepID=A0A7N2R8B2_QUELO
MNMTSRFKLFFVTIITKFIKLFSKYCYPQLSRPSPSTVDAIDQAEAPARAAVGVVKVQHIEWTELIVTFCLASAIVITLVSVSQLSTAFHLLSLTILLAFASFVVSKFIKSKFLVSAQVLENFGVCFNITVFFMAITIPFPLYLKFASWEVYTISALAILICTCC